MLTGRTSAAVFYTAYSETWPAGRDSLAEKEKEAHIQKVYGWPNSGYAAAKVSALSGIGRINAYHMYNKGGEHG